MQLTLAHIVLTQLSIRLFGKILGLGSKISRRCPSLSLGSWLHLGDAVSVLLVDHRHLVERLIQEALWQQDLGRLRLRSLIVIDLGIPPHRGVDGLIGRLVSSLLLRRIKGRSWLLHFIIIIMDEGVV